MKEANFKDLREYILMQKKIMREINSLYESKEKGDMFIQHVGKLLKMLSDVNKRFNEELEKVILPKDLEIKVIKEVPKKPEAKPPVQKSVVPSEVFIPKEMYSWKDMKPNKIERETFKRLQKEKKKREDKKEEHRASNYLKMANRFFSKSARKIVDEKTFETLERDLSKANLQFTGQEYLSLIAFSAIISIFVALFFILFFLFFNIGPELPIITRTAEDFGSRIVKLFWLIFVVPIGTILIMYFYPSMERKSKAIRVDQELPFAVLNMSAIAGSLIDPTDIFEIIISTKEYPKLSEQFTKLINETNVYGYDLVSALRNAAYNSPSKRLAELYGGLAVTITSGGDLSEFFDKRAETLLFEYRLEKEKKTKAAETFMDIYISIVIAAPMILMILLMMMKISGLGVALSTQTITLIMVIAVSVINVMFISFLEVKK